MEVTEKTTIIDALNLMKIRLSHAIAGNHREWSGRNKFCFNRIFMIYGDEKKNFGEVIHREKNRLKKKMPLDQGHVFFMPYNADLEFNFRPDMPIIAFHFNLELFPGRDLFENFADCVMQKDTENSINAVLSAMQHSSSVASASLVMAEILKICSPLLKNSLNDMRQVELMRTKYRAVIEAMEKEDCAGISVKELAVKSGIHRDTLSKAFASDMGIPLKKYMQQCILSKATQKLLYSKNNLKTIAAQLGFANEQYFCMFFKKQTGQSPDIFRKKLPGS